MTELLPDGPVMRGAREIHAAYVTPLMEALHRDTARLAELWRATAGQVPTMREEYRWPNNPNPNTW